MMINSEDQPKNTFTHSACIALGANLGAREWMLRRALDYLRAREDLRFVSVSSFHDTAPVGGPAGQPRYLNAAAHLMTSLSPRELLNVLLGIEKTLGRDRSSPERNQPRVIDLDVLLYDDLILNEPGLELPHPRMHERLFVLAPLCEIAPDIFHPTRRKTIRELNADYSRQANATI